MKILFGKMSESGNIRHEGILSLKDDFRNLQKTQWMLTETFGDPYEKQNMELLIYRWKTYNSCVENRKKMLNEMLKVNITG